MRGLHQGRPQHLRGSSWLSRLQRQQLDLPIFGAFGLFGFFEIVGTLQIEPQHRGGTECFAETDRAVHRDATALFDQIVDAADGQTRSFGELSLSDAVRLKDFLPQDASRVNAGKSRDNCGTLLGFGGWFHEGGN